MATLDVSFRIGGEAGQGVESSGAGFCQALTYGGLQVIAVMDYYSRIRGGHNFVTLRAMDKPVYAIHDTIELLLALNAETVERHIDHLVPGGIIITDQQTEFDPQIVQGRDVQLVRAPLAKIAEQHGNVIMKNTGFLAAAAALVDFDLEPINTVIRRNFGEKGAQIAEMNRRVAEDAYRWIKEESGVSSPWKLTRRRVRPQGALTGNQAFAMGAIVAGCKFCAGYPMTPASSVLEYMAEHANQWGLVARQAEDEISAVNMVVGAAHAGVRAMVPTSGGGYDLMTEGVSLAAMTETPIVVYLAQRPGPATGLATRTAQADLFLALHSSHGEFPRVVMAPHTPEEHYNCAIRAFNLAEKYQCLVIVLSDHHNATTMWTRPVTAFDFKHVEIDRGKLLSPEELEQMDSYQRYALTPDGVSPRAIPGSHPKAVYPAMSDEHWEDGHITEDAEMTAAQIGKRLRKGEGARAEMRAPLQEGPAEAEVTFVGWGSTYGSIHEAVERLNAEGRPANMVHFVDLWPFPAEAAQQALAKAKRIIDVENNATAPFAFLLHAYAGIDAQEKILRFDGRGFTPEYILAHMGAESLAEREAK